MARHERNAAEPAAKSAAKQPVDAAAPPYAEFGKRVSEHAQQMIDEELSQRFGRGASELGRFAEALRSAGARLEGSRTGPYLDSAAGQVERAAQLLRKANARELVDGVERFARQSPLIFIGGALAVGIGAGRFLKSSALHGQDSAEPARPALPSNTRATSSKTTARQSTRRTNPQASQTRGTES